MPASSANLINSALHSALGKKGIGCSKDSKSDIEEQLNASSKQIFMHDIEYESSSAPQSFVLSNLKSKYVNVLNKGKKSNPNALCPKLQKNKMAHSRNEDKLEEPRVTLWAPDKVVLGWRKNFPPGAGMINLGNTCYMNSSLQALFHIPSLVNWLLEEITTHIPSCEANTQNASFCSICAMMRTLKLAVDRGNNVIKPSFIHSKLKSIGKTLMYGRQEDAHEFIKLLLDHMEKCFVQYKRATKLDHRSKETTPLNQIFGGHLRQQVICPLCCYVSTTFSPFQDIVLDIRSVGSVDEALNLYFRKETLDSDNAYKCEKCHKKVPATKRHLIERAPHVLLLQLKRFTMSGGKITKHVNIQKNIDISKYVNGVKATQPNGAGPYFYRLVSMVIHIGGSQHGGHYTAIAEASNNTMFEFDDASVRPISVHSALLRNPYILFYEMVRKPKGFSCPKPVIRQSSEKALLRQSSSDKISKPFPTSLSTSCMWNGADSSSSDNIGEAVSRNGLISENKKSPLLSQRERERISFGIKSSSNRSQDTGKFSKLVSLGAHNGTHYKSSFSSNSNCGLSSSSSSSSSNVKNGQPSSLVPYNDDSDDSENGKELNGHSVKYQENGHVKASEKLIEKAIEKNTGASNSNSSSSSSSDIMKNSNKSSKSIGSTPDVSKSKNFDASADENKSNKGAKVGERVEENKNCRVTDEKTYNSSNSGTSKTSGKKPPFLPRSLQVQSAVNGKDVAVGKVNGHLKLVNANSSDKQTEHKDERDGRVIYSHRGAKESSTLVNGNLSKLKTDNNGWIVTESNERSPSESSSCSSSSSQGFLVTEKQKTKNKQAEKVCKERDSYSGWTVTVQSKHDSEKSLSQDYISSSKRQTPDKSETASLKSKESLDSNRSDKSTKSMKKSFFSLFPCVSSSQSPDLTPEEEQTNSVIENKVNSPVRTDPKRHPSLENFVKDTPQLPEPSSSINDNDASDDDNFQLKRNRDNDEHEPVSPFKKCRPEDKQANVPVWIDNSGGGGKGTENASRLADRLQDQKDEDDETTEPKTGKGSPNAPAQNSLPSFNCNKNERNLSTRDEENFSMEEKKSRHKRKNQSISSNSEFYLTNGISEHVASNCKEKEESRLNPNVVPVEWNRHLKDLSHDLQATRSKNQIEITKKHCAWDGTDDLSVVNALKEAGELPFGVKVDTWDGRQSFLTYETQKGRNEAKKRTLDEMYDDNIDQGKAMKKRQRMHLYNEPTNHKENPFQKFQNNFINKPTSFSQNHFRSNGYRNGNRNNSYPYNRKFGNNNYNNQRRNSWHSASTQFHPQNHFRAASFSQVQNGPNHWHQNSGGGREKFYNRKREKFRFKEYSRY